MINYYALIKQDFYQIFAKGKKEEEEEEKTCTKYT